VSFLKQQDFTDLAELMGGFSAWETAKFETVTAG